VECSKLSVKSKRSFPGSAFRATICVLLPIVFASLSLSVAACCERIRTIAVDVGHSQKSSGALSARNAAEYTFKSRLANLLLAQFQNSQIEPVLINEGGEGISLAKLSELINRGKPDLLISIHHDSVQPFYLSQWKWDARPHIIVTGTAVFLSSTPKGTKSLLRASDWHNSWAMRW